MHEVEGGRRRAASNTSSSTSSSRSSTSVKDTLEKRRMQVQEGDGERDGDDDATAAANDEGNGEDGGERDGYDDATHAANDEGNGEDGADNGKDGDTAAESRPDIQAKLRKAPGVIVADTWANRPQRTRAHTDIYQARTKTEVKKPGLAAGRGRGRR